MVWYDVDLKDDGVAAVNKLFSDPPYSVVEVPHADQTHAYVSPSCVPTEIFCYDKEKIVIYHGVIEELPAEIQRGIQSKLMQVAILRSELSDALDLISPG